MRRASLAGLVGLALALAACGEKQENLEPAADDGDEPTPTVSLGSTRVQVQGGAAKELAREAATARVSPDFALRPADWTVACKYGDPERASCRVRAGVCRGVVFIYPTKVPAGDSPEGYAPRADARKVGCRAD